MRRIDRIFHYGTTARLIWLSFYEISGAFESLGEQCKHVHVASSHPSPINSLVLHKY